MALRIIACLISIAFGAFATHTVWSKPSHSWSGEPADQAIGIPKIVTRVIRGAIDLLFVGIGVVGILRTLTFFPNSNTMTEHYLLCQSRLRAQLASARV